MTSPRTGSAVSHDSSTQPGTSRRSTTRPVLGTYQVSVVSPSSAPAAIRIAAPWLTSTTSPSPSADELLHGGQEPRPQVQCRLPAGQVRVELAAPPRAVDLVELLERRLVRAALQVADEHLVHAVEHLDRESVRGGDRLRGLLRPDRPRGVHGADGVVGEPFGEQVRLRPAELVERGARRAAVEDAGRVGGGAPVPDQHEPHSDVPVRSPVSQRSAAANASASVPCSGTAGAPTPGAVPFVAAARG